MTPEDKMKLGFDAAQRMTGVEAQIIWAAFRTMLGAHAFLIAFGGAALTLLNRAWVAAAVAIAGMLLCIVSSLVLVRQFGYFRYWIAWARHLEESLLATEVEMFARGKTYGEGAEVQIGNQPHRMSWFGRHFKVQWLALALVLTAFCLYVALLVLSFITSPNSPHAP